ncbi:MAG: alpha/beta hydrolase [Patescibacteria group bacterium]
MQNRVIIVHGWDGYPENGWFPWLKRELEARGFLVVIPQLPFPQEPRIVRWIPALQEAVGLVDEQTFFIGHSMGCQTIVRLLSELPEGQIAGGAVFVAGFFSRLTNLEDNQITNDLLKEWLKTPIDFPLVKNHLKKSIAIFSDNDEYVPLDNQDVFKNDIGSSVIIEHKFGHFSESQGITEVQSVLESVLKLAK